MCDDGFRSSRDEGRLTRREMLRRGSASLGAVYALGGLSGTAAAAAPAASLRDVVRLTDGASAYHESPAAAGDGQGRVWVASLQRIPDGTDRVALHAFDGREWHAQPPLTPRDGAYDSPRLACAPGGQPRAAWIEIADGRWRIQSAAWDGDGFGAPETVVDGPGRAAHPALIAAGPDRFALAWESYEGGRFRVFAKIWSDGRWGEAVALSDGSSNAYDPALAAGPDGTLWAAWSQVSGVHRGICLRRFGGLVEEPRPVIVGGPFEDKPNLHSHPAIACDRDGAVWITWEGLADSQPLSCYFGRRRCPVVRYRDGRFEELSIVEEPTEEPTNDHLPVFVEDGEGRLRVFARRWHPRRKWDIVVGPVAGASEPAGIGLLDPDDMGRCHAPAVVADGRGGWWVAWQADNFSMERDWFETMPEDFRYEIRAARVELPVTDAAPAEMRPWTVERKAPAGLGRSRGARRQIEVGGERYTLLWGNLHEHSNISRCWKDGSDGELDDNYRYGIDVEGYDFVAITDHCFDLNEERWRASRRAAAFYNDPDRFVALPAYEWTLSAPGMGITDHVPPGSGHRNVIFPSDEEAAKAINEARVIYHCRAEGSDRCDRLWQTLRARGIRAITIPHHPVIEHPMSWEFNDPDIETVVEIFQCRGSAEYPGCPAEGKHVTPFEGCYVSDALARGYKLGFIASGDHNFMGLGVAAVYVKEVSPEGVFEALQARRCYGTMGDRIFVDFRVNGRLQGEAIRADGPPRIAARVEAVAPLRELVVFRGRDTVYEVDADRLGGPVHEVDFEDAAFPGSAYYYLRATQADGQIAWSSPVWVDTA